MWGRAYVAAFYALHRHRSYAVGMTAVPMPLAYTEVAAYAKDHGWGDSLTMLDDFISLIMALDAVYIHHETSTKPSPNPAPARV